MAASPDSLGAVFGALAAVPGDVAELRALVVGLGDQLARMERRLPPVLLSPDEAAKALGVSRSTVKRMIASGELPATKIGRLTRVDVTAVRPLSREKIVALAAEARAR
jgi:excisionase family DNA binding protein